METCVPITSAAPAAMPPAGATNERLEIPALARAKGMEFSLFFFSADGSTVQDDKYRLFLESVQFADRAGLAAIWTPERHFHQFGGLYPSPPSALNGALAMITEHVAWRAGSVVLPLHHPFRLAEEWSVIDNLSKVGLLGSRSPRAGTPMISCSIPVLLRRAQRPDVRGDRYVIGGSLARRADRFAQWRR